MKASLQPKPMYCSRDYYYSSRQQLRFSNVLHRSLKKANITPSLWEDLVQDCTQWRNAIRKGVDIAEKVHKEATEEGHKKHHNKAPALAALLGLTCQVCRKQCLSKLVCTAIPEDTVQTLLGERNDHYLVVKGTIIMLWDG